MNKEDYQEVLEKMEKATGNEVFCDVMCRFPYELNEEQLTEVCERCSLTESCEDSSQTITNLKKLKSFHNGSYGADIDKAIKALEQTMWIPVSERLPKKLEPVNITWVNHNPESYYADIKNKPFTATGHYCKGKWYWYSSICQDYLEEYGRCDVDEIDKDIEVIAWMPLPEPYKGDTE